MAAATNPAKLQSPWNEAMMGLCLYSRSTPTAWVFTAMLVRLPPTPNSTKHGSSCHRPFAQPRPNSATAYSTTAHSTTRRLPCLATSHPASGSDTNCPNGIASSTPPSAASEMPMCCCTLGMRDAQLAKHRPNRKNKAPTATR